MSKYNIKIIFVGILFSLFCLNIYTQAQQNLITISGKVSDVFGNRLIDVSINDDVTDTKSLSDQNGDFSIQVRLDAGHIIFSKLGYSMQKVDININHQNLDIVLIEDNSFIDKRIELGYSSVLNNAFTGAASTVTGVELEKSPVAVLSQSLAGRLSGLSTREVFSELSRSRTILNIRGRSTDKSVEPLVIIDGMIVDYNPTQSLEYISAYEIESITVLKDASVQALYGIQGANGVIVIKTKRGITNGLRINTRFDHSLQQVTTKPLFINSWEYAEMRNQAILNDFDAGILSNKNAMFSQEDIDNFRSGENRNLYPNNNWYEMFMKSFAFMDRANINIVGGNERVQYFNNLNFMYQSGQFNTDPNQKKYNPNPHNIWFNFRSNVDLQFNNYISSYLRLSGNIKREHTPGNNNVQGIYSSIFTVPSIEFGPMTPEIVDNETGEIIEPGGTVVATDRQRSPLYGELNRRGYFDHTVTNITTQFGVKLNLNFLTKGLDLEGLFSYQTNSVGSYGARQDYVRVLRVNDYDSLRFSAPVGDNLNTPLSISKGSGFYYHLTYMAKLNYERVFGKDHMINGIAYGLFHNLVKSDVVAPLSLPYNRINSGLELLYGLKNRYYIKGTIGYGGSEQFEKNNRFTVTPAVSGAWVISNEPFIIDMKWLNNLKIRGSYGKTANDILGLNRYSYLDDVNVVSGGFINYFLYNVTEKNVGNKNLSPELSTKYNIGTDLGLFNSISISFDLYREKMNNMIISANSIIPAYQGVPLTYYPKSNYGQFENKGFEISAEYSKKINKNVQFSVGGFFDYNQNKILNNGEPELAEDYAYRKRTEGFPIGQSWGYLVDYSNGNGFFNSEQDLQDFGLSVETEGNLPRIGDLIYKDLNNDKIIDSKDLAPIGNGGMIPIYYGFFGKLKFNAFDINLLFQGVSRYSTITGGIGVWEMYHSNYFSAMHKNAWTKERYEAGEKITYPALSTQTNTNHKSSDFFEFDRSYLRLKNVEIAYNLPTSFTKLINATSAKVTLSGQNLFTWDKMKTNEFGPEHNYDAFPVYKVYSIGINLNF